MTYVIIINMTNLLNKERKREKIYGPDFGMVRYRRLSGRRGKRREVLERVGRKEMGENSCYLRRIKITRPRWQPTSLTERKRERENHTVFALFALLQHNQ